MWAIQLYDGKLGVIYLREYLLDGRILLFETEEAVLRFMIGIRDVLEPALRVRLRTLRYSDDPRKDKPYKVPTSQVDVVAQSIVSWVK